jgi:hypothetical protein
MRRLTGSALAVVLVVVIGREARAQAVVTARGPGGFGQEYTQSPPSNSVLLDRWWMLEMTPAVGSAPAGPPDAAVHATPTAKATRPARTARSLSRMSSRRFNRDAPPASTPLPTGSLYWPGAASVPLYSPANRYATYGQGYGVSPYGSMDYGMSYKGLYWGY